MKRQGSRHIFNGHVADRMQRFRKGEQLACTEADLFVLNPSARLAIDGGEQRDATSQGAALRCAKTETDQVFSPTD